MFDVSSVEVKSYDLMEKGIYPAMFIQGELKTSKAGNDYVNLRVKIIDGKYKDRQIFYMINHKNSNPEAVSIAMKSLKELLMAIGTTKFSFLNESDLFAEIMNKPLNIKVDIQQGNLNFADKNIIKGFSKYVEVQSVNVAELPF